MTTEARDIMADAIEEELSLGGDAKSCASYALAALTEAGKVIVGRLPEPVIDDLGRHEVPGTDIKVKFTEDEFQLWVWNGVLRGTIRKTFDREAGDALMGALLAAKAAEAQP